MDWYRSAKKAIKIEPGKKVGTTIYVCHTFSYSSLSTGKKVWHTWEIALKPFIVLHFNAR
jgi:hypothetical protein